MSECEVQFGFGAIDSPIDVRDYEMVCSASPADFPAEFELDMPPVKYQGIVGSCVAHALSTVVEYFNKQQTGKDVTMSTGFIYGNRYNTQNYNTGMITRYAIANLQRYGDVPHEMFPENVEVPTAYTLFEDRAFELSPDAIPNRITSYYKLDDEASMKHQLMTTGPIIMTGYWSGQERVDKDGLIYQPWGVTPTTGHCTVIYGWNELGWKVQNSWGDIWGKAGRCIVKYNFPFREVWGVKDELFEENKSVKIFELELLVNRLQAQISENNEELETMRQQYSELSDKCEQQEETLKKIGINPEFILESKIQIQILSDRCEKLESQLFDANETLDNYIGTSKKEKNALLDQINQLHNQLLIAEDERDEYINNYEAALQNFEYEYRKLADNYAIAVGIKEEFEDKFNRLSSTCEEMQEKELEYRKTIEDLQNQIIEVEKPFKHWPKWLINIINYILNIISEKNNK